jgi:hypothetical protein
LIALTMVSVCPLELPVRGKLDTDLDGVFVTSTAAARCCAHQEQRRTDDRQS